MSSSQDVDTRMRMSFGKSIQTKIKTKCAEHEEMNEEEWIGYTQIQMVVDANCVMCRLFHYQRSDNDENAFLIVSSTDIIPSTSVISAAKWQPVSVELVLMNQKPSVLANLIEFAEKSTNGNVQLII